MTAFIGNMCYYATRLEALEAGLLMSTNSMRVREMRVVERNKPAAHRFDKDLGRTVTLDRQNVEAA